MGPIRRVALFIAAIAVIPACGPSNSQSLPPAPSDPFGLTVTPLSTTRARLDWSNGPLPQTAVSIERSSDDVTFVQVALVSGTAVTYTDTTLLPSTTYFYRVLALDVTTPSANYSNMMSVTTGTPAWSPVSPTNTPPTGRINMGATNALVSNQMIVCAGDDISNPPSNTQTWALQYSGTGAPAWTQQGTGTNPGVRSSPGVAYDPTAQVVILFGGFDTSNLSSPMLLQDVWMLSRSSPGVWGWSPVVTSVGPLPDARTGHAMVFRGSKLYVIGGQNSTNLLNDVWTLDFASPTPAWQELFSFGPWAPRAFHTAIYDSANDQIVIFGGLDANGTRNDTWALKLSGAPFWSLISSTTVPPSSRSNSSAVYDASAESMIVFGGAGDNGCLNDVWMLSLSGTPVWSPVLISGTPPSIRSGHVAVFDEGSQRMIIFGGQNVFASPPAPLLFDVWQLQF